MNYDKIAVNYDKIADAMIEMVRLVVDYQSTRIELVLSALIASGVDVSRITRTTSVGASYANEILVDGVEVWRGEWRWPTDGYSPNWSETDGPGLAALVKPEIAEMMRGGKTNA